MREGQDRDTHRGSRYRGLRCGGFEAEAATREGWAGDTRWWLARAARLVSVHRPFAHPPPTYYRRNKGGKGCSC
ncbi:hypothetical protein GCM10028812_13170 [Ancylobacter sonchi]